MSGYCGKCGWTICVCDQPTMARPNGRMSNAAKRFLKSNPEFSWKAVVCPEHGKWFSYVDRLAPAHWDMCRCPDCGKDGPEKTKELDNVAKILSKALGYKPGAVKPVTLAREMARMLKDMASK